jgi:hypothetical protein
MRTERFVTIVDTLYRPTNVMLNIVSCLRCIWYIRRFGSWTYSRLQAVGCHYTDILLLLLLLLLLLIFLFSFHMFFLVLFLLDQWWTPPLRLKVSDCSTFLIMCDVPSTAVFCTESIEFFPYIVFRYFFSPLVTIPVAPMITGMTKHFIFHIRLVSILTFLYFDFFSGSFCITFLSDGIATSISKQI